jgi:hypothetical protein
VLGGNIYSKATELDYERIATISLAGIAAFKPTMWRKQIQRLAAQGMESGFASSIRMATHRHQIG